MFLFGNMIILFFIFIATLNIYHMRKFIFIGDVLTSFWNYTLSSDNVQKVKNVLNVGPDTTRLAKSMYNVQKADTYLSQTARL